MSTVAIFPDVEKLVVFHLINSSQVTDLVEADMIVTDVPDDHSWPLCRVRAFGGPIAVSDVAVLETTSMQIDVWGTTRGATKRVASTIKSVLERTLVGTHEYGCVKRVRATPPQYLPDSDAPTNLGKPRARYLFTVSVTTRVPRGG